jgi:hypothetical protein
MKAPKQVLFVSISFPPKKDPECLQTAKYFKYLQRDQDLSFSVVTSAKPTLFMPSDDQLEKYCTGINSQIEIKIIESKITNFLLRKFFPGGIEYPDSKFSFHWQKRKVLNGIKRPPDVIYSRSNPVSSAVLAYKLSAHYGVPWIMHLSDPWVDSPVKSYSRTEKLYNEKWERLCFHRANTVCLTSLHAVEFYKRKYPSLISKFEYYPNVFDSDDSLDHELVFSEKLKICYTGGLSGERSAKNFLMACQQLVKEKPQYADLFEVIFAGPLDRKAREIFDNNKAFNVRHLGELSYHNAIRLIHEAHILLNIDLPIHQTEMAMFFASKLLDYFLAKRKILSLTTSGSASEILLKKLNASVLLLEDIDGMKAFLESAILAFQRKDKSFFYLSNSVSEFSAETNANRLAQLLKSF